MHLEETCSGEQRNLEVCKFFLCAMCVKVGRTTVIEKAGLEKNAAILWT